MARQEITATVQVDVEAAGVARPGDTLVLAVRQGATPTDMKQFGKDIETHLPGVKVIVVNANALAVYRPESPVLGYVVGGETYAPEDVTIVRRADD